MINDVVFKGLMKMVKNFISPAQIKEAANSLMKSAIDFKNKVETDPAKGEAQVIAIFYEVEGVIYFGISILDSEDKILRTENKQPLDSLIDNLIQKL